MNQDSERKSISKPDASTGHNKNSEQRASLLKKFDNKNEMERHIQTFTQDDPENRGSIAGRSMLTPDIKSVANDKQLNLIMSIRVEATKIAIDPKHSLLVPEIQEYKENCECKETMVDQIKR